ncbi:MAG TPA: autotransporter domain-containing protein, partial [Caulobacteraceae bacterium]|nr:autotransporter domain-containing protein [Caulobacteraceae bacterium]
GPGSSGIFVNAGNDVTITSGNVTTNGGLFSDPGGNAGGALAPAIYPAGSYAADGIFAESQNGNITITAGNISAPGPGADGIVADAKLNIGVTVTGAVSANDVGIELSTSAAGGQTTVTVQPGGRVLAGFVGVDLSGSNAGPARSPLSNDLGTITVTNNGTIGGASGFGVLLGPNNGPTTIVNTGTIGAGAFGIAINGLSPTFTPVFTSPLTITNSGTISGGFSAIDVTVTGAPLVINGGGTFNGGQFGILAFGDSGPITINAGNTTGASGAGIIAEANSGAVSVTSGVSSGNSTAPTWAILATSAGNVSITSGTASATGGFVANLTAHSISGSDAIVGESGQGDVRIVSGAASVSTSVGSAEAIYAQALNGAVTVVSGSASATGPASDGIFAVAGRDINITSGNVTTNGGLFADPGGTAGPGGVAPATYPAGNYASDGIFALSSSGNITITAGNISAPGADADGIVANAAGTNTITVTGAVTAQDQGVALASGGASTVTVASGAVISATIGIDASGAGTGFADGATSGVLGGLNVIDDGTITGTGGTAIQFNPGANSLTLGTGWAINGQVVGGTNNSLILAGGVATPTASQDAPSFTDFSSLEVKTGYWTLPSAAGYANTTVDAAGALEIDTSLSGNLTDNGEVVFNTPGDLTFGGTFGGDGELVKDGPGVLTFSGTYDFTGVTQINAGSIDIANLAANATLDVTGGTLNISGNATIADITGTGGTVDITGNATVGDLSGGSAVVVSTGQTVTIGTGDYTGNLSGGGSLDKTGNGTLTLAGNDSLGGNVTVGAGTVNVTGNLSAPQLAVDSGASLGGNGTITGSVTVASGGTFSPGDPVTTHVNGNVLFAKGSTYVAQVTAGGASDLIAVKGNVTIKNGATFEVEPLGPLANYHLLSGYEVISATGSISGTFSKVTSTMPLLDPFLFYSRHDVLLLLVRNGKSFASQAWTPNQAAAAAAAEAGGPDSPLYTALVAQSADGLRAGYSALSGEGYADVPSMMLEQSDETRRSLVDRMEQPAHTDGLWVASYNSSSAADAGANFAHARTALGAAASGVDLTFSGWRVGLATSYGYDSLSISARATSTLDAYWTTSAYAAYDNGAFDARFGATYGWHRLSSNRNVEFPGFGDADRSLSHVSSGQAFAELGWTWKSKHGWVEPFAGVSVDSVGGFAATEFGGVSALNVATDTRTVVAERFGVQGETTLFGLPGLTLSGSLAWRHAEGDLVGAATLTFEGTGQSFTVHGLPIAANAAEITAGLSGKLNPRTTLDLSYHGEAGDHFSDNAMTLHASWKF